ncbi:MULTISPECIES: AraC family transcriptional regulator [Streptomyces]|uniref:AraC family transcriptional regulator n=1 Tax=Streptomyces TaxID=1883 RepID=UPI00163B99DA|nr:MULTISPECIES: helix-turn-helix transcriptional regulator [Streptomyces]MBC2877249.1 helix-turn-helix transcriptional regulator [Streptomyces sp. TYQ1024]UBI39515.1 helix-turn-helix transcriptional regulator [Streptomyces mobaraensis]UKW32094.1 helix-turn-helix transcriptional regulator [Streptomyces sp. TYQ1024]
MPRIHRKPDLDHPAPDKRGLLAHGDGVAPHSHAEGQLLYPATGVLATTTERGTWVTPPNRVTWTPPGFEHHHRAYGRTDVRVVEISGALCAALPDRPMVFTTSPLLREALLVLTGDRELRPDARARLREVVVDELVDVPDEGLYLPEPSDDRLRAVTDLLHADPATPATLAELGRTVGASERTLSRLFATELGMSFQRWRSLLRVQHALVGLAEGDAVIDTATRLGWANPTSFIEAFTAIVGQTPGRYRTELRRAER